MRIVPLQTSSVANRSSSLGVEDEGNREDWMQSVQLVLRDF